MNRPADVWCASCLVLFRGCVENDCAILRHFVRFYGNAFWRGNTVSDKSDLSDMSDQKDLNLNYSLIAGEQPYILSR